MRLFRAATTTKRVEPKYPTSTWQTKYENAPKCMKRPHFARTRISPSFRSNQTAATSKFTSCEATSAVTMSYTDTPTQRMQMRQIVSVVVDAVMSPYPTVLIVMRTKYSDWRYRVPVDASAILQYRGQSKNTETCNWWAGRGPNISWSWDTVVYHEIHAH